MEYFYENVEKLMKNMTFDEAENHIQLFPCLMDQSQSGEGLMEECPHFISCGFIWLYIVDLSEIDKDCHHVGMITKEIAQKWFQNEDDAMMELQDTAFLNLEMKEKNLRLRTLYDQNFGVPVYMYTMDNVRDYTISFMMSESFLISTHRQLGDFYVFPRYADKFFVISQMDVMTYGRPLLDVYYSMLMKFGFTQQPIGKIFSQRLLYCDDHELRVWK